MGSVSQALETLGLVSGEPRVHRVSMHAELLGYLSDPHPFSDDGQDGVITLFHLAELPEHWPPPASGCRLVGQGVGYQPNTCRGSPEHASEISRIRNVGVHPELHNRPGRAGGDRTHDPGIMRDGDSEG